MATKKIDTRPAVDLQSAKRDALAQIEQKRRETLDRIKGYK